jgi:hypothetical protein
MTVGLHEHTEGRHGLGLGVSSVAHETFTLKADPDEP